MLSQTQTDEWQNQGLIFANGLLSDEDREYLSSINFSAEQINKVNKSKELWLIDPKVRRIATSAPIKEFLNRLFDSRGCYLWSAQIIERFPGQIHPWHSDVETTGCQGEFVSLWIAISSKDKKSTFYAIAGSHRLETPLQALFSYEDPVRTDPNASEILKKFDDHDSAIEVMAIDCDEGDGIFFDGCLWHGTFNGPSQFRRTLLLQYGRNGTPVRRVPDLKSFPFILDNKNLPRVLPVSGQYDPLTNHNILADGEKLRYPIANLGVLPHMPDQPEKCWNPFPYFKISTPTFNKFSCHASILQPGCMPHLPHDHQDEEILIVLSGNPTILSSDIQSGVLRMKKSLPGDFFYYPSGHKHTILNASNEPIHYLMFRWETKSQTQKSASPFNYEKNDYSRLDRQFSINQASSTLEHIHIHFTHLEPGKEYQKHIDQYDAAVVVLDGHLTVMNKTLGKNGVFFTGAGELHNTSNSGSEACSYLVFEFHV
jgi:uncharacterized cupin superfamily protein